MKGNRKGFLPVLILFVVLNGLFIAGKNMFVRWNADTQVLIGANLLLFLITLLSFLMALRGMRNPNPHAFVRSVYGSVMIKLFICIIAAFIYIATLQKNVNKPALFISMGLYLVYTFVEVSLLMKMLRQRSNG